MKTKPKSIRVRETIESLDMIVAKAVQETREQGGLSPICAATFADAMAEYLLKRERILSGPPVNPTPTPTSDSNGELAGDVVAIDLDTN